MRVVGAELFHLHRAPHQSTPETLEQRLTKQTGSLHPLPRMVEG